MDMKYTFRFDDISLNTDIGKLEKMIAFLRSTFSADTLNIMLAVSPAVHRMCDCERVLDRERNFPAILHTESDYRVFYKVERVGVPPILEKYRHDSDILLAGHGMIHADHRLLPRRAQELSIVMSCSLIPCKIFIPPFHKWNAKTEAICREHDIELLKYDRTWRHLVYHKFDRRNPNWYVHTHDFHYQDFCARFA